MKKQDIKKPEFKEDWREKNPSLHLLYVKTAVKHLAILNRQLEELYECYNGTLQGAEDALRKERDRLVKENAAYADAKEIIGIFRDYH